jgi:hypothetical protein
VLDRLQAPGLTPGMAREARNHVAILEREIAELARGRQFPDGDDAKGTTNRVPRVRGQGRGSEPAAVPEEDMPGVRRERASHAHAARATTEEKGDGRRSTGVTAPLYLPLLRLL